MALVTVSITQELKSFMEEQQKKGLSPSRVFADALENIKKRLDVGLDTSTAEYERKIARLQNEILRRNSYLESIKKDGAYNAWVAQTKQDEVL